MIHRNVAIAATMALVMMGLMALALWFGDHRPPRRRGLPAGFFEAAKAESLLESGRYREAADAYRRMIDASPALVITQLRDGVSTSPTMDFERAVLYHNYGKALQLSGDAAGALGAYATLDELVEHSRGVTRYAKGAALIDLQRYPEAIAEFEAAIALDPTLYDAHQNRCAVLRKMGRYEESIAACQDTISRFPGIAKSHFSLGRAYELSGQTGPAAQAYGEAMRLAPHWPSPRRQLEQLMRNTGTPDPGGSDRPNE